MTKKDFTGGLGSLLGEQSKKPKRGRPKTTKRKVTKTSQEGTKENETRATFIVKEELLDKVKAIAYWERSLIKDVINKALEESIENYQSRKGKLKDIPKK